MTSDSTPNESDREFDAVMADVAQPPSVPEALFERVVQQLPELHAVLAAEAAPVLAAGVLVDQHYRVERVLGRGGMGVVYAAENLRTGKRVALKCMSLRGAGSAQRKADNAARFRREARVVASIRHPNVVDVYDAGGSSDAPYLVMELLEGESLRERMRRGPLGWPEAREIFTEVLAGVAAAHSVGIVHRDLKPDNIFLARTSDSQSLRPKVLDFGIASVREVSGEERSALTRTGTLLGTPSYMAPEQLTADSTDERTDVYALGVLLYEMLSARLPFSASSASALAVLQATAPPVPLSLHRPELRGSVEALVMRALARRPADRHPSVVALAAAVQAAAQPRVPSHFPRLVPALAFVAALAGAAYALVSLRGPGSAERAPAHAAARPVAQNLPASPARPQTEAALVVDAGSQAAQAVEPAAAPPPAPARHGQQRAPREQRIAPAAPASRLPTDLRVEEF